MKKILFIALASALFLISCSQKEEEAPPVGWKGVAQACLKEISRPYALQADEVEINCYREKTGAFILYPKYEKTFDLPAWGWQVYREGSRWAGLRTRITKEPGISRICAAGACMQVWYKNGVYSGSRFWLQSPEKIDVTQATASPS